MFSKNITIRKEEKKDYHEVENLVRESFWNVYRPGCYEHYLLHQLRNDKDFIEDLDLVMVMDDKIIGQIIFMKSLIKSDNGDDLPVMTIGPVCIGIEYQRQGYGKLLLEYALNEAKRVGCGAICLEGNIEFYGKVGFNQANQYGLRYHGLPKNEDSSFFLCKELINGYLDNISGEYYTPQGYFIDESEVDVFDQQFSYKEKVKLPGQLF